MEKEMRNHKSLPTELLISELLHWGVIVSLVLIVLGTCLSFLATHDYGLHGGSADDLGRLIASNGSFTFSWQWLGQGLLQFQGQAIVVLGLLLLIGTPVLRVAMSIVVFAIEKDRAYMLITGIVLGIILLSFALGKAG